MAKYYYIDKNGNKKKYAGKVILNDDGTYSGVFTTSKIEKYKVELTKHEAVDRVYGYSSYYTYLNNDGQIIKYYNIPKIDENYNPYFTYSTYENIDIKYHPEVKQSDEYFTYNNTNGEFIYTGSIEYDYVKQCYIGKLIN